MSLASVPRASSTDPRAELVAALEGLPELTARPYAPDQPVAGDVWPRWVETRYPGKLCSPVATDHGFDVIAVVPAGYAGESVDAADKLRDQIAPILSTVARIEFAEPIRLDFGSNQFMPAVRFRVRIS